MPLTLFRSRLMPQHGFNRQTLSLFITDTLKQLFISAVIGLPLTAVIIRVIQWANEDFYIYVFLIVAVFQIIMTIVVPDVIMPWFNKFTPVPEGSLKRKIEELAKRVDFPLKDVSRRFSAHFVF